MEDALLGSLEAFQKPDLLTLSIDMKTDLVLDIAKGLDVLHDSGIAHGDLSPSQRIRAKLSDFDHEFKRRERLNATGIQDLKRNEDNELLRLARSTTETWPQWNSEAFVSISTADILGVFTNLFSMCLQQNPLDRASSMKDILKIFNQEEKKSIPRIAEPIGDGCHSIYSYKFPTSIHNLRFSPIGFRTIVVNLLETIAKANQPKSDNKARAALCLAICHLQQFHPKNNKPEALEWLVEAAHKGDAMAQSYIRRLHDACQLKLSPKLPIAEWLYEASHQGLTAAWMELQELSGHEKVSFRPFQINKEPFSSLGLHNQTQLKSMISSIGSTQMISRTTPDGESLLHYAAATGMSEVISAFGQIDFDIDCKNRKAMTPLHLGCWNGQHSAINELLLLGADVNSQASGGITPLHLAVASLDLVTVNMLLGSNSDVSSQSLSNLEDVTGRQESYYSDLPGTPLHWAVCRGLVDITKALLRRRADPTVKNVDGYSALQFAASRHDPDMLEILYKSSRLALFYRDKKSQEVALEAGRTSSLQSMLCTGKPSFDSFTTILQSLASYDAKALLLQAIPNRSVQVVKYLIEELHITKNSALAKSEMYDGEEVTTDMSLNALLCYSAHHASGPLVKLLLSLGADPRKSPLASTYGGGISILHGLASNTNIDCSEDEVVELARILVSNGADVNSEDPITKATPVHTAVFTLKPKLMEEFLRHGADPLAKKTNGHTPYLDLLTDNYSWTAIDVLAKLIERDPEILLRVFDPADSKTNFFHVLSEAPEVARDDNISAKMCKLLIGKLKSLPHGQQLLKAQLEQRAPFTGYTPLHSAAITANEEVLKCILEEGSNVNATELLCRTPMTLARSRDSWKTYLTTPNAGLHKEEFEKHDLRTQAWIQCSRHDGWLKYQARARRIVTLLKEYGGTEPSRATASSPVDEAALTAMEAPLALGDFFKDLNISGDGLSDMVARLEEANRADGVVVEGGLGFLTK
ncbi:hypothetical protein MMC07_006501 [Pseudocyphellaria aurata]|nr:hypothetical protein [Pseudocyphellaria aurata]